nr:ankyrin repeat-containing protein NPR4-like isoform X3 [Ipomoea batatas]
MRLYRAAAEGNWEEAEKFLSQHSHDAIHAPLNYRSETALHLAAKAGAASMAKKLVEMLSADNILRLRTHKGLTALHVAAKFGNTEVAEILVGYNHNLLYQSCDKGLFPIHYAACNTRNSKDVFLYFSAQTKDDAQPNPYAGQSGATILVNLITSKFYVLQLLLPKSIKNKIQMRQQAVKLLKCFCDKLKALSDREVASVASEAIIRAAELDIDEVILNIVEAYPPMAYYRHGGTEQNILFIAVQNRCENVFYLVCGNSALLRELVYEKDNNGNNIVHLAGKLAPPHKVNLVSCAALQMQWELQWFKEVQKIAPPYFSSLRNKDDKTPKMVFRDEHKDLKIGEKWMKDAATSCSIAAALIVTVVFAAAITVPGGNSTGVVTEGFNATTTLPLGSNNNTFTGTIKVPVDETPPEEGLPTFSRRDAFIIFYISNGASLFTSVTSLLLFLSILTSRYTEEDFLYILPTKLIIGLFTLIMFVMATFSSTVYLVFGKTALAVRIVLIVVACVPEVKKITPSHILSIRNKDGKTPSMVFTEEHKELKEEGEKWMKDTANSCTIAAALIVTVVFAAAITVPGGNSEEEVNTEMLSLGDDEFLEGFLSDEADSPIATLPPSSGEGADGSVKRCLIDAFSSTQGCKKGFVFERIRMI